MLRPFGRAIEWMIGAYVVFWDDTIFSCSRWYYLQILYKAFPQPLFRNTEAIYLNETRLYIKYAKTVLKPNLIKCPYLLNTLDDSRQDQEQISRLVLEKS